MAGVILQTVNYLKELSHLSDAQRLRAFFTALAGQGYHMAEGTEPIFTPWYDALQAQAALRSSERQQDTVALFREGLSPQLLAAVEAFSSGTRAMLTARAYSVAREGERKGIHFSMYCEGDAGRVTLSIDSKLLNNQVLAPLWMELNRLTYQIWHPLYAFPYLNTGEHYDERDEVLALRVRWLYRTYNFWGPELVTHVGRERVLNTPGARVEVLDDSGALILPYDTERAAVHLGLAPA